MPQRIAVEHNGLWFEWDEDKNRQNIEKHGLDFAEAQEMFRSLLLARPDVREDYGENRWVALGAIGGRIAVLVFAEGERNIIRVISLRKANRGERKKYEKAVQDELEAR